MMHLRELHDIRNEFLSHFSKQGYIQEPSVQISSNIDPSTFFIGSTISPLKKYVLSFIPSNGVVIDQPAMRFRELKKIFNPTYKPFYGTFFNAIGALTPSQDIETLCEQMYSFFTKNLEIPENNIVARVSSKHEQLLKAAREGFANLEIDTMPDSYYRHVIGLDGYEGINFNIAIKNKQSGKFEDVGNLLSFEKNGEHAFLELGFGDTVIQRSLRGYEHVLDCYQVKCPESLNRIEQLNYVNSIIVSSVLYREGLEASNKTAQTHILRQYVKYLSLLKCKNLVTYEDIGDAITHFEKGYYGDDTSVKENILLHLNEKENVFKKALTDSGLLTP